MIKAFTLLAGFILVGTSHFPTTVSGFTEVKEQIQASEASLDGNMDDLVAQSIHLNDRRFALVG